MIFKKLLQNPFQQGVFQLCTININHFIPFIRSPFKSLRNSFFRAGSGSETLLYQKIIEYFSITFEPLVRSKRFCNLWKGPLILNRVVFMKKIAKITFGACIGPKMVHFLCRGRVLSSFKIKKVFLAIFKQIQL